MGDPGLTKEEAVSSIFSNGLIITVEISSKRVANQPIQTISLLDLRKIFPRF